MSHPWTRNLGALSASLYHSPMWLFWNKFLGSLLETVATGIKPATAERSLWQKLVEERVRERGLRGYCDERDRKQRWWAVLWVDLYFLGLLQQGLDRPYGLALTLASLHALRAAALAVAGFHFLLFLALGVLITGRFNIIIQNIR